MLMYAAHASLCACNVMVIMVLNQVTTDNAFMSCAGVFLCVYDTQVMIFILCLSEVERQLYTMNVCCSSRGNFHWVSVMWPCLVKLLRHGLWPSPLTDCVRTHTHTGDGFNHRPTVAQTPSKSFTFHAPSYHSFIPISVNPLIWPCYSQFVLHFPFFVEYLHYFARTHSTYTHNRPGAGRASHCGANYQQLAMTCLGRTVLLPAYS